MGIDSIIFRDAPVSIEPLTKKIAELEAEIVELKAAAALTEIEIAELKKL